MIEARSDRWSGLGRSSDPALDLRKSVRSRITSDSDRPHSCSIANAYDKLKELTRGKEGINRTTLQAFITTLEIPEVEKQRLLKLSPETYIGMAAELAKRI